MIKEVTINEKEIAIEIEEVKREGKKEKEQATKWVESLHVDRLGSSDSDSGVRLHFISWLQH